MLKYKILNCLKEASLLAEELDSSNNHDVQFTKDFDLAISNLFEKLSNRDILSYNDFVLSPESLKIRATLKAIFNQLTEYATLNFDNQLELSNEDTEILTPLSYAVNMMGEQLKEKVKELKSINIELENITQQLDIKNQELSNIVKEKELLFQELHHRVKNNLQVISGLLQLQRSRSNSETIKSMLLESEQRIKSMALVHEKLYKSDDLSKVFLNDYTQSLIGYIAGLYPKGEIIQFTTNYPQNFQIPIDIAINYGLLINEILSNSFKHAFDSFNNAIIKVDLKGTNKNINLNISDNGGCHVDVTNLKTSNTLGLKLIYSLSKKLGSDPVIINKNGLNIQVKILLNK